MRRLFLILLALSTGILSAQQSLESGIKSPAPHSGIRDSIFDAASAWNYLDRAVHNKDLWRSGADSVVDALRRLLDHTREPYDSISRFLLENDFSKVGMQKGSPVIVETIDVRWINDSIFVLDPRGWNPDLYLKAAQRISYPLELSTLTGSDSIPDKSTLPDSALFLPDTTQVMLVDTAALQELGINIYSYSESLITPPLSEHSSGKIAWLSTDLSKVYYALPASTWIADENSPFYILSDERQLDSLQRAISTLLEYNLERDSSLILIDDMLGQQTPYWLTSGRDETFRFWVKNFKNDSLTLWVGNPGRNRISLIMEDDINLNRLVKEDLYYLPEFLQEPPRIMKEMSLLEAEPIYWDYEMSNLFGLSQTYLSNWTKGGESTLSTTIDIIGRATYNNKEAKTQWINLARWKYGTIWTKEKGNRVNNDLFEVDSKYNMNAWGKIGMSSSFYGKTQIAKGYNYPNDSVAVSRFLNPGTITVGIGAEYKPIEKTTINMAPLSYKTTFVLDTVNIDQTRHGIDKDQMAKREFGFQVVITNQIKPYKDLTMINRMRLFSNYLYRPQNIDVDWEMILEQRISWFFSIRLNLHLIYDDDVRFPVYNEEGNAIILPDGSPRLAPKPQFREFLGLTLSFKI